MPGWIGYGVLNGLIMASSGHAINDPARPVPRSYALLMTGITLVTALVCRRFTEDYQLNAIDKIAVMIWLVCLAVAMNGDRYGVIAFSIGGSVLGAAWLNYVRLNRSDSLRSAERRRSNST